MRPLFVSLIYYFLSDDEIQSILVYLYEFRNTCFCLFGYTYEFGEISGEYYPKFLSFGWDHENLVLLNRIFLVLYQEVKIDYFEGLANFRIPSITFKTQLEA